MENKIYAVIDTNVLVSALLTSEKQSNPLLVFKAITDEKIVPLFCDEILNEYREVLSRDKFPFNRELIDKVLDAFVNNGLNVSRVQSDVFEFPDPKDIVFFEVSMAVSDSYLVTGNIKHFPKIRKVVTPTEMVAILDKIESISLKRQKE